MRENVKRAVSVLAAMLVVFGLLTGCGKSVEKQIAEQLELGNKYLTESDYEQAIVAFNRVIELDPKSLEAYCMLSEIYMQQGSYEESLKLVEKAEEIYGSLENKTEVDETWYKRICANVESEIENYAVSSDESEFDFLKDNFSEKLESIKYPDKYLNQMSDDMKEINQEYTEKLKYLYDNFKDSDLEAISDFFRHHIGYYDLEGREDGEHIHISAFIESDMYYGKKIYYGETNALGYPDGFGVAMCEDNGVTYNCTYFGSWENGKRSGHGILFATDLTGAVDYYDGNWEDDKPNGAGVVYDETMAVNIDPWRYLDEISQYYKYEGNFVDGLYDGDFNVEHVTPEEDSRIGHAAELRFSFTMGKANGLPAGTEGLVAIKDESGAYWKPYLVLKAIEEPLICRGCEICIEKARNSGNQISWNEIHQDSWGYPVSPDFVYSVFGGFDE